MEQGGLIHHKCDNDSTHTSADEPLSESMLRSSVSSDVTPGDGIARVNVTDLNVRAPDLYPRTPPLERVSGTAAEVIDELRRENERLRDERAELLAQNRTLRREATLGRLYHDLDRRKKEKRASTSDTTSIPASAAELYHSLPIAFKFADFFRLASECDVDTATARRCLLYFLEEQLLMQTGSRLHKTDRVIRQVS